jgi:hypothetical protein
MLLDKELNELADWFQNKWPDGKFSGHAGYDKKDRSEEYHIVFSLNGKHWNADPLRLPSAVYTAPREALAQFRKDYLKIQKAKIEAAVTGLIR